MADLSVEIAQRIQSLVRGDVLAMSAYAVPDASDMVKLDAMENPFSWPGALREAWLNRLQTVDVNRYPDPEARLLCEKLRGVMGIADHHNLILGNGSDEIIQLLIQLVATDNAVVMAPDPSFVMFKNFNKAFKACRSLSSWVIFHLKFCQNEFKWES